MRCADALRILVAIEAGDRPSEQEWEPLVALGLVRADAATADNPLERLQLALKRAVDRRKELEGQPPNPIRDQRLQDVTNEVKTGRLAVLAAAEQAPSATGVALTFRGRDLIGELQTRPRRAESELADFFAETNALRLKLGERAQAAATLLAAVSPKRKHVDEVHLRAAAVGLGATPNDAVQLLAAIDAPPAGLAPHMLAAIVEGVLLNPHPTSVSACITLAGAIPGGGDDALWAALVLLPLPPQAQAAAITPVMTLRAMAGSALAAALLYRASPEERGALPGLCTALEALGTRPGQASLAAALLILAPGTPDAALARFKSLFPRLCRFAPEPGLAVPTAMLTLLALPDEELLDDLRLACAAIQAAGLSLGPVENVGLGIKLLMHVACVGDPMAPSLTLALPPPVRLPHAVQAISTFHAATVHLRVVEYTQSHRLHGHRGYG